MSSLDQIQVLAFDIFGTVVDWHSSIVNEVNQLNLGIDSNQFALDWRAGYRPAYGSGACRRIALDVDR